jgi:uncharacterized repeat protein (TIGR04052 family)
VFQRLVLAIFAIFLASSCSRQYEELEIPFVADLDGVAVGCGAIGPRPVLSDLRFYVSAPAFLDQEGSPVPAELVADGLWQQHDLALIDLEDGSDSCENGTAELNSVLKIRVPPGQYRGLKFVVGVPFDRNHSDPLQAAAPLGDPAMHWHWRSGYKFLRAGVVSESDDFWIHVGSTACEGTVRNITGCGRPNRSTVNLPDFIPGEDAVLIDIASFFAEVDLLDSEPSDCSSGPAESACEAPFRSLGIDFATGEGLGQQQVFRRRAGR